MLTSRFGSLLLLFQRSPLVQMLFPEARVLGSAGLAELTKWTVTSVVGLGAYDTVAGATSIAQVSPVPGGGSTVPAEVGKNLTFVFQITGVLSDAQVSWSVGELPPGLTHADVSPPSLHRISGVPLQEGSTTVTITAWEQPNQTGKSYSEDFQIEVIPQIILTHPASVAIANNTAATLSVAANAASGSLVYRWFEGISPNGTQISNANGGGGSTYTTPTHTTANTPENYWVRVTRTVDGENFVSNSNTATVTIATAPAITDHPDSTSIPSGTTTNLSVAASGTSPSIQWYRGASGITTNPVSGATSTSFTTPVLTTTTSYWARASNAAGSANSTAATVTVVSDPYEEWRAGQFNVTQLGNPQISGPTADPDGDGVANQDEYVFGTAALLGDSSALTITSGSNVSLAFTARLSTGAGYSGKTRHYSLERRAELETGSWAAVAGFEDITGSNQPVNHIAPAVPPHAFYRLRVWLTP